MSKIHPNSPGLSTVADNDPTGNGVQSVHLVYRDPATGEDHGSGIFAKFHGATIQFYQRAADSTTAFAVDGNGRAIINQL